MALSLPAVLPFDIHTEPENLNAAWTKWSHKFDNYLTASGVKDGVRQKALLLHCVGEPVQDVFYALPGNESVVDYDEAKTLLTTYFALKQNVDYEIFKFREAKQLPDESIDEYHVRLRSLATFCDFSDLDLELKRHIVQTCTSKGLRRKALQDPQLVLSSLLQKGRLMERSEIQASSIEKTSHLPPTIQKEEALFVQSKSNHRIPRKSIKPTNHKSHRSAKCGLCGGVYPHPPNRPCPAKGKNCHNCGKPNHFSSVCRSASASSASNHAMTKPPSRHAKSSVNVIQASPSKDTSEFIFTIINHTRTNSSLNGPTLLPYLTIRIGVTPITLISDTGTSVNILNRSTYNSLASKPLLEPTQLEIFPYGSTTPLKLLGKFASPISTPTCTSVATFYVVEAPHTISPCILGFKTLKELNILPGNETLRPSINLLSSQEVVQKYPKLFQGIGKAKNIKIKLAINEAIPPVAQPHRRIPFHLREALEAELAELLKDDIIEPVCGPTPWVSPVVLVLKKSDSGAKEDLVDFPHHIDLVKERSRKVRLCVDMRVANSAIVRERHVMPTIDDIIHKLNGATVFTKLDLNKGYHQLELDESSRDITTFSTHKGLFRYKRLSFGVSSAAEVFHHTIRCLIQDIDQSLNVTDDLLVFGHNVADHDRTLEKVLHRLEENNITLNLAKCQFQQSELHFYGHVLSQSGVRVNPSKIDALKQIKTPTTPDEIRSLIGLATYCSRFIPNFSDVIEPLRTLTKKNTPWTWGASQDQAIRVLIDSLSRETVLSYFDPERKTMLYVDASPTGLGSILSQIDTKGNRSIISFGSKALTDVETRYSQTEREALAVVWGCEHYHLYLYGAEFTVVTDHLPLLTLLGNPKAKTSARIERWNLRLAPYDLSLEYQPGKLNPADYLSRHPIPTYQTCLSPATENHVYMILYHALPKAITFEEVVEVSKQDATTQQAIKCLITNHWVTNNSKPEIDWHIINAFEKVKNELSVVGNVILKDHRIYIPPALQRKVVSIAHEGHLGVVKTKQLLRTKVWFPKMDGMVEQEVRSCIPCLAVTPQLIKEPLAMTPLPNDSWSHLATDHLGPFKNGQYLLVLIDERSRFPIAEIVSSTSLDVNVKAFNRIFSIFGLPTQVKTDNGPPFNSHGFGEYLSGLGIKHRKITPIWPQANGNAERFMASLNKVLRISEVTGQNWKDQLQTFLSNYRQTPHRTTGVPPSQILFGRPLRNKLPSLKKEVLPSSTFQDNWTLRDATSKAKIKRYHDKNRNVKHRDLHIGDKVLVKTPRTNKLSPYFRPDPFSITAINGPMITAERNGQSITRNVSLYKQVAPPTTPKRHVDSPSNTNEPYQASGSVQTNQPVLTQESLVPEQKPVRYNLRSQTTKPKRLIEEM